MNLQSIAEYFDDFSFHSRVMPVIVASIPLIAYIFSKGLINKDIFESTLFFLFLLIFLVIASKISREFGKKKEEIMVRKLGALPTTIILRYSDKTLDLITKTRYHKKLNSKIDGINLPLEENDETTLTDEQYASSINWLRKYANSNQSSEQRVYQELKEYNFWRNLYGIKNVSLFMYAVTMFREFFIIKEFHFISLLTKPYPKYISFIIMISSIIVMLFYVNKSVFKKKAFDYAKTLLEVCDNI